MRLEDIDKNFKASEGYIDKNLLNDIEFYDGLKSPFSLYGVAQINDDGIYRLPKAVAHETSEGVEFLSSNTAGVRVRFRTDSDYVAVHAKYGDVGRLADMPFSGTAGFDLYVFENGEYERLDSFVPPLTMEDSLSYEHKFPDKKVRDITIEFPTYSSVKSFNIGLKKNCMIDGGGKYINDKPIVFYGSSITQGACASRTGLSYESIISRRFNCDYINLGFSGGAKGEKAITEYIKNLDMCCLVYDYDHNAPNPEHLRKTHKPMFDAIREANPDLPIIMASMIWFNKNDTKYADERREVILDTYNKAIESGDKNVYFIDGKKICEKYGMSDCTVDGIHPNDLGFFAMAESFSEILEKILKK